LLLPLWLFIELFSGADFRGSSGGVAHWRTSAVLFFGAIGAVGLGYSGLEHVANQAIEAKVAWTADPALVQATEKVAQGNLDEAISILQTNMGTSAASIDACALLSQLYWRKNDIPNYHQVIVKLCQMHLKHKISTAHGRPLANTGTPAESVCQLDMARTLPRGGRPADFERAVEEYDKLARAYPTERQSL